MNILIGLQSAVEHLTRHRLRTTLTLIGMIFGVAAVITMINIGEGARRESLRVVESLGVHNLLVESREMDEQTLLEVREHSVGLSAGDMRAILDTIPGVVAASEERRIETWSLFSFYEVSTAQVVAVSPEYFELARLAVAQGRLIDAEDQRRFAQIAVLGAQAASSLFPAQNPIGQKVKINQLWVEVVGVLQQQNLGEEDFEGVRIGDDTHRVFIPVATARKRLSFDSIAADLDAIRLRLAEDAQPQISARSVDHLLARRHGGQADYEIIVPADLLKQRETAHSIFTVVMSAIAGISLLVGGIGIMNIMLATVLERRREIGLLRAVGARKRDIQMQFVLESLTVAGVGAIIGIVLGLVLAYAVQHFAGWPIAWSPSAIVLSVGVCLTIGMIFGWYPAKKAANLDPIKALHSE